MTPEALAEVAGPPWHREVAPVPRGEEAPVPTRDNVDDVVGDAQGLVEILCRGYHLLKHLP